MNQKKKRTFYLFVEAKINKNKNKIERERKKEGKQKSQINSLFNLI